MSTGNTNNGRRINQTIEIGQTIESMDIDAITSPLVVQMKTIQPQGVSSVVSPMGALSPAQVNDFLIV